MSIATQPLEVTESGQTAVSTPREVVAVVLHWRGRIGLFKRSRTVGHDRGLWHCITGYVEPGATPREQALAELGEEAGLAPAEVSGLRPLEPLLLPDERGALWLVHAFAADTARRRLVLNDEHDAYRWTVPSKVCRFSNRVPWLDLILQEAVLQEAVLQDAAAGRAR